MCRVEINQILLQAVNFPKQTKQKLPQMCQREIFELITEEARYACKVNKKYSSIIKKLIFDHFIFNLK